MDPLLDWFDPQADRYITLRAGEQKVLEVPKHWAALIGPWCRLLIGFTLCTLTVLLDGWLYWLLMWFGWVLLCEACWRHLQVYRDRFVITTVRIFRLSGVISTKRANIPISRITDYSVKHPTLGQILNYGHLRFESAGLVQDLERIKFVRNIDRVDDVLRVVSMRKRLESAYEDWTPAEIQAVLDGT